MAAALFRAYIPVGDRPLLPSELRTADEVPEINRQAAFFDFGIRVLTDVAESRPLILMMEDEQLADQASLDLLRYVIWMSIDLPILIDVSYRDDDLAQDALATRYYPTLIREGAVHRLMLQEQRVLTLVDGTCQIDGPMVTGVPRLVEQIVKGAWLRLMDGLASCSNCRCYRARITARDVRAPEFRDEF